MEISRYRHPLERFILFGTTAILLIIIILTGVVSAGIFSLTIVFILVSSFAKNQSTMRKYIKSAQKITKQSHPRLWKLFSECREKIDVHKDTSLYLLQSDVLNAWAIGFWDPCQIVLTTAITDHFSDSEIKSIIGHELGHIHFGHTRWSLLTGVFDGRSYGIFGLQIVIRFLFLFYSRMCEYSADRAGLIACGNLKDAISAELKLNMAGMAPDQKMIDQYLDLQTGPDDTMIEDLYELVRTHPTMKGRIKAMLKFSRSLTPKPQAAML